MQSERDFNQQGEDSQPLQINGRYGRQAKKWFSFDLPVEDAKVMAVVVTYSNDSRRNTTVDVLADGKKVGEQSFERRTPEQDIKFFDVQYVLPADLVKGKQKVTIRFEGRDGSIAPGVFGIRIVRAELLK
jgi:hypothetical protein